MKDIKVYLISGVVALAVALLVVAMVGGNNQPQPQLGATGTRFPNGLSTDSTSPVAGEVRGTTLTITGAGTIGSTLAVTGAVTLNGKVTNSVTATTTEVTAAAWTLTQADLASFDTAFITKAGVDGSLLTITLPATSTLTTFVSTAGERAYWSLVNNSGTNVIKINAGTGMDIMEHQATTTAASVHLLAGQVGRFEFIRQATSTDMKVLFEGFENAD